MTAVPITMRADPDVKALFEQICAEIGLSVNAALNIFVKRVVRDRKPEPLKGNLQGFWSRRIAWSFILERFGSIKPGISSIFAVGSGLRPLRNHISTKISF